MEATPNPSSVAHVDPTAEVPLAGRYAHQLDGKGRLVLPSSVRPPFVGQAYVTPWEQGRCLAMWSVVGYRQLLSWARGKAVAGYRASADAERPADLLGVFQTQVAMVRPDAQGRFVLPVGPREAVGITTAVDVVGANDHLELWAPERVDDRERRAAPMAEVMFEDYEHEDH